MADPLLGTVLDGRYRVDRMLARGGMSTVYAGTDLRLDRRVAVKVMAPALAHDPAFTDRFVREARTAARLSHANAVAVFDQGAEDTPAGRVVFLVMELVAGSTLRDVLRQRGRLRPDEAVSLLEPVLAALAAAHRAGLVHRDVKPENVLISAGRDGKVVDFGLARAVAAPSTSTQAGMVLGTVAYVAPEQVTRGAADPRTDVYSAGILLFELLTGSPPYAGDSALAVAYRHVHDDVPPPSSRVPGIAPALDELVQRATRREPGGRPADAGALLAELTMVRADLGLRRVPPRDIAPDVPDASAARPPAGAPARRPAARRPAHRPGGAHAALARHGAAGSPRPPPGAGAAPAAAGWPAERRSRRRRAWLVLLVVLALTLTVGGAAWWFGSGRFVVVPPLADLTRPAATARVHAVDLTATFRTEPNETVADGRVIRSDPAPATGCCAAGPSRWCCPPGRRWSRCRRGRPRPDGRRGRGPGRPGGRGRRAAERRGGAGPGRLPAARPAARLRRGSTVRLVVSTGPDVVAGAGRARAVVDAARRRLEDAGFRVRVRSLRIGNVVVQQPAPGHRAAARLDRHHLGTVSC